MLRPFFTDSSAWRRKATDTLPKICERQELVSLQRAMKSSEHPQGQFQNLLQQYLIKSRKTTSSSWKIERFTFFCLVLSGFPPSWTLVTMPKRQKLTFQVRIHHVATSSADSKSLLLNSGQRVILRETLRDTSVILMKRLKRLKRPLSEFLLTRCSVF